jgi:hypothetical protein
MSTFTSPQPVAKASAKKRAHFLDFVMILINPQLHFHREEAGPLTISIRSNKELGIPDKPYTVESPLTMGIPSIKTKV